MLHFLFTDSAALDDENNSSGMWRKSGRREEERGGSDLIFDHMSAETKVWLTSRAPGAPLHLETPAQVMFFEVAHLSA